MSLFLLLVLLFFDFLVLILLELLSLGSALSSLRQCLEQEFQLLILDMHFRLHFYRVELKVILKHEETVEGEALLDEGADLVDAHLSTVLHNVVNLGVHQSLSCWLLEFHCTQHIFYILNVRHFLIQLDHILLQLLYLVMRHSIQVNVFIHFQVLYCLLVLWIISLLRKCNVDGFEFLL